MGSLREALSISGETKVSTSTREERKTVRLSYLDTLRSKVGDAQLGTLSGTSIGGPPTTKNDETPANPLLEIASQGFFGRGSSRSVETQATGWSIADQWNETVWDIARYAIGIRDLRAFTYKFATVGEKVSVEYRTPKPISKVTLKTDELIPKAFNYGKVVKPWILYWVTFDNGAAWHPIAPLSMSVINMLDGAVLPVTINVNSGIPEEEQDPMQSYVDTENDIYNVRLRWRLTRPTDFTDQSPVLKRYILNLSVKGGL